MALSLGQLMQMRNLGFRDNPSLVEPGSPGTIGDLPAPGAISGFGGGTWNADGAQATPVQRTVGDVVPPRPAPSGPSGPTGPLINQLAPNVRQSFDYDKAADTILGPQKKPSTLQAIGQILLPALMAYRGNQQGANQMISSMANAKEYDRRYRQETVADLIKGRIRDAQASDDAYYRDTAPFTSGRDRLRWNPETGRTEMLHKGEQDFEAYAKALGLEEGTDPYFGALEDYVLRANGPSALERNKELDSFRTGNDVRLENLRQSNRSALEGQRQGNRVSLRQTPTYRDTHGAPARQSSGGSRSVTATDANGNTVRWDGKQWVPVK
jgi:hypothetical protein